MLPEDIERELKKALPHLTVRSGEALNALDPGLHKENLRAGVMALPGKTDEVSALLRFCSERKIPVVPQGGRTGLAGGAVAMPGQLIVSQQKMNRILHIDAAARLAIVEAGVTLASLQAAAAEQGLSPGIDLGARDTATIGGMISTNAGGIEAFRHGVMRQRAVGLEAVLPDGTVIGDLSQVGKCNEGLDVKQLFIGAEGTLGIVTRAVIRLATLPPAKATALVAIPEVAQAVSLFNLLSKGNDLLAFELMNPRYFALAAADRKQDQLVSLASQGFVFLIEMQGATFGEAQQDLEQSLGQALESGQVVDAVIAKSSDEARRFWILREDSWVVDRLLPHCLWFDVTVPLSRLDHYLKMLDTELAQLPVACEAHVIGHLGDGNMHLTVASRHDIADMESEIKNIIFSSLKPMGGSFSAEHGIGLEKKTALARWGDPGKRQAMQAVKQALDPHGIMNPGKIF